MIAPAPQPLIELTTDKILLRKVREALEEISTQPWNDLTHPSISSAIAKRLKENPNIYCYSGKPTRLPKECNASEWLFDFCALLYKESGGVRFVVQAAVIGETEWDSRIGALDCDFEKLLIVDSIVCFFVCGVRSHEEAKRKLDRYEEVVRLRKEYAAVRGTRPPSFLLACYVEPQVHTASPAELVVREV